jgi:hypothetical protein
VQNKQAEQKAKQKTKHSINPNSIQSSISTVDIPYFINEIHQ